MLRHNMIIGSKEGMREAVLLGRAWGITPQLLSRSISATAFFFTGFEGLYAAHEALDDLL